MNHVRYTSVPMTGKLLSSEHIGYKPPETILPKALDSMRKILDRGMTPPISQHINALKIPGLAPSARALEQAYRDALNDPLKNPTSASIKENTGAYVITSGLQSVYTPDSSRPARPSHGTNLGSPTL